MAECKGNKEKLCKCKLTETALKGVHGGNGDGATSGPHVGDMVTVESNGGGLWNFASVDVLSHTECRSLFTLKEFLGASKWLANCQQCGNSVEIIMNV